MSASPTDELLRSAEVAEKDNVSTERGLGITLPEETTVAAQREQHDSTAQSEELSDGHKGQEALGQGEIAEAKERQGTNELASVGTSPLEETLDEQDEPQTEPSGDAQAASHEVVQPSPPSKAHGSTSELPADLVAASEPSEGPVGQDDASPSSSAARGATTIAASSAPADSRAENATSSEAGEVIVEQNVSEPQGGAQQEEEEKDKQAPEKVENVRKPTISVPVPDIPNTMAVQGSDAQYEPSTDGRNSPASQAEPTDEVRAVESNVKGASATSSQAPAQISSTSTSASAANPTTPQLASSTSSAPTTPRTPGSAGIRVGKGPPPTTQASEERPFDFNRFLEQMRTRSAQPVGEYVKSFIKGFSKKPYRVTDQQKLIFDFLDFISGIMRQVAPFSTLSQAEFENAMEAMEKLIMNRLYSFTFSPAIARDGRWKVQTDDLERDRVFRQRVRLFGWIKEEHLDVPMGEHSQSFVEFAKHELLKINHYKAPRDKLICVLNSCKVIFGLIRHLSSQESADTFIPCLIFVVLKANPDHLISNVEYIGRFRNPDKLSSESGYYLSSLMGAIAFIETMDYTSLSNITQQEFEAKVETAIQDLAKLPPDTPPPSSSFEGQPAAHEGGASVTDTINLGGSSSSAESETAKALPAPPLALSFADDTKAFFQRTGEVARAGLGASLGRPMGALGRLLSDGIDGVRTPQGGGAASGPNSGRASPSAQAGAESPGNSTSERAQAPSIGAGAGRRLFAGLFGGEPNEKEDMLSGANTASSSRPLSGFGSGSWTRAFRGPEADEDPGTPIREDTAGRPFGFSGRTPGASGGRDDSSEDTVLGRGGRSSAPGAPVRKGMVDLIGSSDAVRPPIHRQGSVDPYSMPDEDLGDGVRTPTDDGSEDEQASNVANSRGVRGHDFRPPFLNEGANVRTPTRPNMALPDQSERSMSPTPRSGAAISARREEMDVAAQSAEISRVHLAAGVETVVEMVLEGW